MSKVRKNVSIDAQLAQIVDDRDEFNLSGFVNRCLEQHFAGANASSAEEAVLKARLEEIEDEIEDTAGQLDTLRSQRSNLEEQLEEVDDTPALLDQAIESLDGTPRDPENPAVQKWASKLGVPSEELVQELPELETGLKYE